MVGTEFVCMHTNNSQLADHVYVCTLLAQTAFRIWSRFDPGGVGAIGLTNVLRVQPLRESVSGIPTDGNARNLPVLGTAGFFLWLSVLNVFTSVASRTLRLIIGIHQTSTPHYCYNNNGGFGSRAA